MKGMKYKPKKSMNYTEESKPKPQLDLGLDSSV